MRVGRWERWESSELARSGGGGGPGFIQEWGTQGES